MFMMKLFLQSVHGLAALTLVLSAWTPVPAAQPIRVSSLSRPTSRCPAAFSGGYAKPELAAPGVNIISVLSDLSARAAEHPEYVVWGGERLRLSGISMAAATVSLLPQGEPRRTLDQVNCRLPATACFSRGEISARGAAFPHILSAVNWNTKC